MKTDKNKPLSEWMLRLKPHGSIHDREDRP